MTKIMTYKGYSARIEYDVEDDIFTGRLAGISDGVGFHADTDEALRNAFQEAVDDYIETCEIVGKKPQKAPSDQDMFGVDPDRKVSTSPLEVHDTPAPEAPSP